MKLQANTLSYKAIAGSKIAFGKGFSSGKGSSSSSRSERTSNPKRVKESKPRVETPVEKTVKKAVGKVSDAVADSIKTTRLQLLEKLEQYGDDAVLRKIILEQLRKLG